MVIRSLRVVEVWIVAVAAEWTGALVDWRAERDALKRGMAPALGRAETRASAGAFIDGLLSSAERKRGWMLAEQAGLERPHRIQSLLGRSMWSAAALGDLVRDCAAEALGDEAGVLVVDETGFPKKGGSVRSSVYWAPARSHVTALSRRAA